MKLIAYNKLDFFKDFSGFPSSGYDVKTVRGGDYDVVSFHYF